MIHHEFNATSVNQHQYHRSTIPKKACNYKRGSSERTHNIFLRKESLSFTNFIQKYEGYKHRPTNKSIEIHMHNKEYSLNEE